MAFVKESANHQPTSLAVGTSWRSSLWLHRRMTATPRWQQRQRKTRLGHQWGSAWYYSCNSPSCYRWAARVPVPSNTTDVVIRRSIKLASVASAQAPRDFLVGRVLNAVVTKIAYSRHRNAPMRGGVGFLRVVASKPHAAPAHSPRFGDARGSCDPGLPYAQAAQRHATVVN